MKERPRGEISKFPLLDTLKTILPVEEQNQGIFSKN